MYCRHGGFLDDVRGFDAPLFRVSPREAMSMDPQQRILLEVAWEALERAGMNPRSLRGSATSVHIGVTTHDYTELLLDSSDETPLDTYYTTGNALNALPGRLSYVLGLQGPSMAVDTACSSSLVAVHLASQGLRTRESDLAIVGGVNLVLSAQVQAAICRANMLSAEGRCKTFAADADGYVRGEGCGVLVLKRLSDAHRDHDPVLAVVRGSAVNQDGASGGFTVPHGPSQQALIRRALEASQVDPRDVDYLEAHGTGTPLGDPIEVNAASAVYGEGRRPGRPLLVGSVKTNIGHLEAAAGVAGLIKIVLAMQGRKIPAHLHFSKPNPSIAWANLPIEVPTRTTSWVGDGSLRIAAISSFGASGTNAHAIVEEAPQHPTSPVEATIEHDQVLILSADSTQALGELTRTYHDFLRDNPTVPLVDLCHTAAMCRAHLTFRCALTAASTVSMREKLALICAGETGPGVFAGEVRGALPSDREDEAPHMHPADIARRFVEGLSVPWPELFSGGRPIALPTYPFQHRPYWAPRKQSTPSDAGNTLYHCTWELDETYSRVPMDEEPCHWILLADPERLLGEMAQALQKRRHTCTVIHSRTLTAESVLQALRAADDVPIRIVHLAGLEPACAASTDAETLTGEALRSCLVLVDAVKCANEIQRSGGTRIWVVTRGAQQIELQNGKTEEPQLALSALWGLGRTLSTEHPDLFGGLIDLSPESGERETEDLICLVTQRRGQVALRDNKILVPRIHPLFEDAGRRPEPADIKADATYLVTGGLGALGLGVARWLVDRGARHIVLVSRRGETQETDTELEGLRKEARIWAPRADTAILDEVDCVMRDLRQWPALRGVFHLAGVLDDRMVARLDGESIERALKPKVAGAWNLHLLTKDLSLDHFVMFSSLASLVGPAGQGNYAAGNAFLDALALYRRAEELPALSLNWGPWSGNGMTESLGPDHLHNLKRSGIRPLHPRDAFRSMKEVLRSNLPQAVVAHVDWKKLFAEERPPLLLEWAGHLAEVPGLGKGTGDTLSHEHSSRESILAGDPGSLATRLTQFVTGLLCGILKVDSPQALDLNRALDEYGMDSLTGTELKNRVASRLGVDLPVSRLIGGVTVSDLVQMIQEQLPIGGVSSAAPRSGEEGPDTIEIVI
jgi:acyl transferase domain-containing protein/acyl carrier protein